MKDRFATLRFATLRFATLRFERQVNAPVATL